MGQAKGMVTPDEIDRFETYHVANPSTSATWFGTAAAGTASQAKSLVVINQYADYPRNLNGIVTGSAAMGGVFVVNGLDQFGAPVSETITVGTATNGGTTAGTKVFAKFTSGTFTFASDASGNGTPTLGCVTTGTLALFGLPCKIGGSTDVKSITWINNGTPTTLNGGTIGAYVSVGAHAFRGTSNVALTDRYVVTVKSTYDNSSGADLTRL